MKIVGKSNRDEIETDPQKAWDRGLALDALLRSSLEPHSRGVWRLTHREMNALDFSRQVKIAARLNKR